MTNGEYSIWIITWVKTNFVDEITIWMEVEIDGTIAERERRLDPERRPGRRPWRAGPPPATGRGTPGASGSSAEGAEGTVPAWCSCCWLRGPSRCCPSSSRSQAWLCWPSCHYRCRSSHRTWRCVPRVQGSDSPAPPRPPGRRGQNRTSWGPRPSAPWPRRPACRPRGRGRSWWGRPGRRERGDSASWGVRCDPPTWLTLLSAQDTIYPASHCFSFSPLSMIFARCTSASSQTWPTDPWHLPGHQGWLCYWSLYCKVDSTGGEL